jgi:hypothetical protein
MTMIVGTAADLELDWFLSQGDGRCESYGSEGHGSQRRQEALEQENGQYGLGSSTQIGYGRDKPVGTAL